jgi:glycosyltransferase involved in cell wall biosynthesis
MSANSVPATTLPPGNPRAALLLSSIGCPIDQVVIINDASIAKGGATEMVLKTLRLLAERGIRASLICGDDGKGLSGAATKVEPVGGIHIADAALPFSIVNGLYNYHAGKCITRWIEAHDTPGTIYHLHGWSKILSPSTFSALRPVMRRVVVHAHDFFLVCPNGGYFDYQAGSPCERTPLSLECLVTNCDRRNQAQKLWRSARQFVRRGLVRFEPKQIGAVLAVHDGMLAHLRRGGIDIRCLRVLRNPVEPWHGLRVRAEHNRDFIFIGRLEADKGPDLLARAARQAAVPVRFIGDGPLGNDIASIYPGSARLGRLSLNAIMEELKTARLLVMPSRTRETFGLAAFEAMRAGVPVMVPSFAMIAAEVAAENFGLTVNPYDVGAMAAMLHRLARDDAIVCAMSKAAYSRSGEFAPSSAEWLDQLLGIYAEVLHAAHQ